MKTISYERDGFAVTETYAVMPDGVKLYTRYTVPVGVEKCAIVFKRTPYEPAHVGKANEQESVLDKPFLEHGYALVVQHCRGRGDSEGECTPYKEREDGLATLDFIRSLPFYNGEIFLFGGSYLATVHWSYLADCPRDVKGICLAIQNDRLYTRNYRNGCNYRLNNFSWWAKMLERRFPDQKSELAYKRPYVDAAKRVFGVDVPEFTEGLLHNTCDDYWKNNSRWNVIDSLKVPVLLLEGWYDFFVDGMLDMWERLPENIKEKSAMFMGPFGHATGLRKGAEYPSENGNLPRDYAAEWFDHIRENRPYRYAPCGKLTYYSVAGGAWRTGVYPVEDAHSKLFYLGDGVLRDEPLPEGRALSYRYDPEDLKRPFRFGNIYKAQEVGSVDGVLSFVSEPFAKKTQFFGNVKVSLTVSSDCEDTAFFMRLYFVKDSEAYNVTETVGALSYFVEDYHPGEKVNIQMETPPCAFTVEEGMAIRVDIASESGVYMPHANVKGHFALVDRTCVATNSVYTEESYVELPLENKDVEILEIK